MRLGRDRHRVLLIAAGISIVIVVAATGIGGTLNDKYSSVNSSIK